MPIAYQIGYLEVKFNKKNKKTEDCYSVFPEAVKKSIVS